MRRRWIGLALGFLTLASGSLARAEDVGCCEAECRTTDASGAALGTMTKGEMSQAECEARFFGCQITWRPEACGAVGGSIGIHRAPDTE